jgi:hypothetical protein
MSASRRRRTRSASAPDAASASIAPRRTGCARHRSRTTTVVPGRGRCAGAGPQHSSRPPRTALRHVSKPPAARDTTSSAAVRPSAASAWPLGGGGGRRVVCRWRWGRQHCRKPHCPGPQALRCMERWVEATPLHGAAHGCCTQACPPARPPTRPTPARPHLEAERLGPRRQLRRAAQLAGAPRRRRERGKVGGGNARAVVVDLHRHVGGAERQQAHAHAARARVKAVAHELSRGRRGAGHLRRRVQRRRDTCGQARDGAGRRLRRHGVALDRGAPSPRGRGRGRREEPIVHDLRWFEKGGAPGGAF